MPVINVGGNQVSWSFGALIAIIVLVLAILLMIIRPEASAILILGLIGALALSRLC